MRHFLVVVGFLLAGFGLIALGRWQAHAIDGTTATALQALPVVATMMLGVLALVAAFCWVIIEVLQLDDEHDSFGGSNR